MNYKIFKSNGNGTYWARNQLGSVRLLVKIDNEYWEVKDYHGLKGNM